MKNRNISVFQILFTSLILIGLFGSTREKKDSNQKPNILFISVDDLRPSIGAYGDTVAQTPNIDDLASKGRIFTRHYVHAPICGPSRAALLDGRRIGLNWDIWKNLRQLSVEPEQPVSMPDFFQRHGYKTISIGKISHRPGGTLPPNNLEHEVPFSWDYVTGPTGEWGTPWRAFFGYAGGQTFNAVIDEAKNEPPRFPFEKARVSDTGYPDGLTANMAVEQLEKMRNSETPFFLGIGFFKPHLPHNAPANYVEMYDPEQVGLAKIQHPPTNIDPELSLHDNFELTTHYHWPWGVNNIPDRQELNQRLQYYGNVSYIDAQIGKVLNALKKTGLDKNTIVVLWSDHGYHLGEFGLFAKSTLFELSTRSPLIIKMPQMQSPGESTNGIMETIDIYPTLAALANLPEPTALEGRSMASLVRDPQEPGKEFAFSILGRGDVTGQTVRTDQFRYIEWRDNHTNRLHHIELYDHQQDPYETTNVADNNPDVVSELAQILQTVDLNLE